MIEIVIKGYMPQPKQRPRLGKVGKVYSPSKKKETELSWLIKGEILRYYGPIKIAGQLSVIIDIYCCKYHGDVDNYAKFILDALQKSGVIYNDSQIISLHISFLYSEKNMLRIVLKESQWKSKSK